MRDCYKHNKDFLYFEFIPEVKGYKNKYWFGIEYNSEIDICNTIKNLKSKFSDVNVSSDDLDGYISVSGFSSRQEVEEFTETNKVAILSCIVLQQKVSFGLCAGRHEIPDINSGYIFDVITDVKDTKAMYKIAEEKLKTYMYEKIYIYVTGLTIALIEVLKVCKNYNIKVVLMHYDRDTNSYFEQLYY